MTNKTNYLFYAITDWLFKKSPVTYLIGSVIGVAGMVASGGLSLDMTPDSLTLTYSNKLTVLSALVVVLCVIVAFVAVQMQMKERYQKIVNEHEKQKLQLINKLENDLLDAISENEKELEKVKADLALEKVKSKNRHQNVGGASRELLNDIVSLERVFAGLCASGRLLTEEVDGTRLDIYIANAIMNQHKYKYVYNSDPALKEAWNSMLEELDASQRAITLAFQDEALDVGVISSTAMSISKFMGKVSESGHLVVTET